MEKEKKKIICQITGSVLQMRISFSLTAPYILYCCITVIIIL